MDEVKERLSNSASKAKRNLLFLSVVAWALAMCWVRPRSSGTAVSLGGVGLETDIEPDSVKLSAEWSSAVDISGAMD
jgi:hypothetical protein